jgi:hypothetical protein
MTARGTTRRELLGGGVAAATAATATATAAAVAGATAGGVAASLLEAQSASAAASVDDVTVLVSLLRVEQVLVIAYERTLANPGILPPAAQQLLSSFLGHERAHVHALSVNVAELGGTAPTPPKSPAAFASELRQLRVRHSAAGLRTERQHVRFLIDLESVMARHYRYAIARLSGARELAIAAEIMANEAQHETVLRELLAPGNVKRAVPSAFVAGIA